MPRLNQSYFLFPIDFPFPDHRLAAQSQEREALDHLSAVTVRYARFYRLPACS